ncbi:hypothetical protein GCM10010193_18990 [Kitasatospora atroaurantiaca]|uniref:RNA polymerase sigma factor n=1 Tax=Kitasatospora atroaurantiaca TaxID=285545 RepID=A0A561EPF5_9ACTN|nr:RNA polymerase sigma factor [Kitasatospora atroaurantiaca]TWE17491.1 RNA polymerase sigma-70 factor (ECF subfamily) [Kitasatospora atroaurantiaca]
MSDEPIERADRPECTDRPDGGEGAGLPPLIEAAQAGDTGAWSELYRLYHRKVVMFLVRRTGDWSLAEDLAQDTFLRAMNCIGGFRWTGKDIGAWLLTIARNLLFDHNKRRSTRLETTVAAPADTDSGVCVEDAVLAGADAARVCAALATLTELQRAAVQLRYWGGLTSQEVADCTGLRVGAVKTLTYRARVRLRQALATAA